MIAQQQPVADALVLFGATGDLAKRKLFPALYHLEQRGLLRLPVIGVARSDWTDEAFCQNAHDAIIATIPDAAASTIEPLMRRLDLIQGDYADPTTWESLRDTLDRHGSKNAVFYMAIPPTMFPTVAEALATVGLNERGRIVVEKPFGRDLESAKELNDTLHAVFPEERIFRIDHYLGKESVEDLLVFRFSNTLLEPVWNRNYVRSVQITMSETIGVEGRGSFYDSVGSIRDVMQNHLLQVAALVAMEPPVGPESSYLQDEKAKVFAAMRPDRSRSCSCAVSTSAIATSQASAKDSETTRSPLHCIEIDSWRWAGVPWYVRCGKALASVVDRGGRRVPRATRACCSTRPAALRPIATSSGSGSGKNDGVTFTVQAKTPGPAPRQPERRPGRRLRRRAGRAPRGVRAPDR